MVPAVMVVVLVVIAGGDNSMCVRQLSLMELFGGRFVIHRFPRSASHRDGRKRLNRKAQCKQHDKKEFAPVGHGGRV